MIKLSGSTIDIYLDRDDFSILREIFSNIEPHLFTEITSDINQKNKQSLEPDILASGLVSESKPNQTVRYLISKPDNELKSRIIQLKDGSGTKTIIDQNYNPDSVEILMGGIAAQSTIVATTLRTTGETKTSKEMFKSFKKLIAKGSKKVGNNFIFPGAQEKLKSGWRLSPTLESHESLDLKLS